MYLHRTFQRTYTGTHICVGRRRFPVQGKDTGLKVQDVGLGLGLGLGLTVMFRIGARVTDRVMSRARS